MNNLETNQTQSSIRLMSSLREHMSRFGYEPTDLPMIEDTNLFLIKAGDQVINQLFTFEHHGKQFALRPEFTASAAYRYITQENLPSVVRWQFGGPIFIDDPNDFSGNHQQLSVGAELIGLSGLVAEAEIIAMAAQGLIAQGVENWRITIGHAGLIRQILARFGLDIRTERFLLHQFLILKNTKEEVLRQFDDLLVSNNPVEIPFALEVLAQDMLLQNSMGQPIAMGGRTQAEIARRLVQKRKRASERDQVVAALETLENWRSTTGAPDEVFPRLQQMIAVDDTESLQILEEWHEAIDLLEVYLIPFSQLTIQPALARSWEYYTGIVFELRVGDFHLGGGGRYDELARLIGGKQDIPAVGFAYYMDQFLAALPYSAGDHLRITTLAVDTDSPLLTAKWAHELRKRGITVQLLPSDRLSSGANVLHAEGSSAIRFNGKIYTFEQMDALIADLKQ